MEISYGTKDGTLYNIPTVSFTTQKDDQDALSKFMKAVGLLIVVYADDLAANPDELHECSISLNLRSLVKKAEVQEEESQEDESPDDLST